jgi:Domain of unknown function DUF29
MAKLPLTARRRVAPAAKHAMGTKVVSSAVYELDFQSWANRQAEALRSRDSEVLDWEHLAEEIESMAASQQRELTSHLKTLLTHSLKWQWESDQRSFSWKNSIENARDEISDLLEQSPSLKTKIAGALPKAYKRAIRQAANEMGYDDRRRNNLLPPQCPWTFEQLMDEGFWPGPATRRA